MEESTDDRACRGTGLSTACWSTACRRVLREGLKSVVIILLVAELALSASRQPVRGPQLCTCTNHQSQCDGNELCLCRNSSCVCDVANCRHSQTTDPCVTLLDLPSPVEDRPPLHFTHVLSALFTPYPTTARATALRTPCPAACSWEGVACLLPLLLLAADLALCCLHGCALLCAVHLLASVLVLACCTLHHALVWNTALLPEWSVHLSELARTASSANLLLALTLLRLLLWTLTSDLSFNKLFPVRTRTRYDLLLPARSSSGCRVSLQPSCSAPASCAGVEERLQLLSLGSGPAQTGRAADSWLRRAEELDLLSSELSPPPSAPSQLHLTSSRVPCDGLSSGVWAGLGWPASSPTVSHMSAVGSQPHPLSINPLLASSPVLSPRPGLHLLRPSRLRHRRPSLSSATASLSLTEGADFSISFQL